MKTGISKNLNNNLQRQQIIIRNVSGNGSGAEIVKAFL